MLTRRQIRVKTMQTVYAQCNGNPYSLAQGRAQIKNSCQQIEQLYFLNLALLKALWDFASQQNQIQKKRKSDTPVNPDFELVEALLPLAFIAQHPKVYELIEKNKINFWEIEFEFVQGLFNQLVATQSFLNYKTLEDKTPKKMLKLLISWFKEEIAPNETLYRYLEDLNIYWTDDLPLVNTFLLKQVRKIKVEDPNSFVFPSMAEKHEDIQFGLSLYEKVVAHQEELQKEFDGKTPNWDPERIAQLDAVLIKIAIAELIYFPEIPPKVTLNEYLEIAKEYSTPKSNTFINGILDNLVKEYVKTNRMNKQGRGLVE